MWYVDNFIQYLKQYCDYSTINSIILIDNQKSKRPEDNILLHPKIKLICYNKNIYVNPAWNEGHYHSNADVLCILNDDVFVEEDIFNYVSTLNMTNIDIIGSYLKDSVNDFKIIHQQKNQEDELIKLNVLKRQPIGSQSYAFGVCMFIKYSKYKTIPSLYKIWYGDDYLIQNCQNIYALKTNKIKGEISKTVGQKGPIQKRIDLDTQNANRHLFKSNT
jgi:hypothetical protein